MAEDRLTIDTATILDDADGRRVEFVGEASGDRCAFALHYDVLEALAGRIPADPLPLFRRHMARIQTLAADALARGPARSLVVISENELE